MQDAHLQAQLQHLQLRLQSLTGEDQEAIEEELASCIQLSQSLYAQSSNNSNSGPMSQTSDHVPSSSIRETDTAERGAGDRHGSPSSIAQGQETPLLLGPPTTA